MEPYWIKTDIGVDRYIFYVIGQDKFCKNNL